MQIKQLNRRLWAALAVTLFTLISGISTYAMPANPAVVPVRQKDGSIVNVVTRGDEFQGWQETTDGYTVVKNRRTGLFEYAANGATGKLVPSGILVARPPGATASAPALRPKKGLRPARNVELERWQHKWLNDLRSSRLALRLDAVPNHSLAVSTAAMAGPQVTGTWAPRPVVGPKKLLVVLVQFNGTDPNSAFDPNDAKLLPGSLAYWSNAVFGANGKSVAAYYRDNSYGKVTISPVHHTQAQSPDGVISITLPEPHPNSGGNSTYAAESAWVNHALAAAAAFVDFPSLDTNHDGTITVDEALIYFVIGGYETAAGSAQSPSIWAHRWGGAGVAVKGTLVNNWALNGERYDANNHPMQIGVIAHEMGHAMGGLPDLYDTSYANAGLGAFSVMSAGSWGATKTDLFQGATPVGMDAWSRQYLGWSAPRSPISGSSISFPAAQAGDASSAVILMNTGRSTSEYWLIENRPPQSWDAGMYGILNSDWLGGLLVQHIDSNIGTQDANSFNTFANGSHQGNTVVEPSTATCHLLQQNPASCPSMFFYSGNADAFDDTSKPPSHYYSGQASSKGVKSISAPSAMMTGIAE